jgi:hypothetical protein
LESLPSILAAIVLVGVGVFAGAAFDRAATHTASTKAETAANARTSQLRDEIHRAALEACRARQEVRLLELRLGCAAGSESKKDCSSSAEGQWRIDPCYRYLPSEPFPDRCPFPGRC